jgi:hypothetical protein
MNNSIGYKWWEKSLDRDSKYFKQASKDLLSSTKAYETFMYLSSIKDIEVEKERLKQI